MLLPTGLTPIMVRKALADSAARAAADRAELTARRQEEEQLDTEGETDPQTRFRRCKAKGAEARIRTVCDRLGIDHSEWGT